MRAELAAGSCSAAKKVVRIVPLFATWTTLAGLSSLPRYRFLTLWSWERGSLGCNS